MSKFKFLLKKNPNNFLKLFLPLQIKECLTVILFWSSTPVDQKIADISYVKYKNMFDIIKDL